MNDDEITRDCVKLLLMRTYHYHELAAQDAIDTDLRQLLGNLRSAALTYGQMAKAVVAMRLARIDRSGRK